jgi:ABC-type sugar transport system permease subunit
VAGGQGAAQGSHLGLGGPVDSLLKSAGLAALIHFWLASTSLVLYTLFFVVTWQFIGFGIVLLLVGLQGIPPELREAAAIDGASSWQITRRIMLPLLGPTIRIWIFLAVIGSLQLFDIVWIMTLGGPANASQTMLTYLYFNGAERTQFGYGATISLSVAMFQSQYSTDTARVFAYTALSMLPALSIFVFAQRYLVGGLVGAIRG